MDYFHGVTPFYTIQQFDQRIQIDWHEGSSNTFEVFVLHMPLHHRAFLFMANLKKIPTMCNV
jgi:hypothetical protein